MAVKRTRTKSNTKLRQNMEPEPQVQELTTEPTIMAEEELTKPVVQLDEYLGRAQKAYVTYLEAKKMLQAIEIGF